MRQSIFAAVVLLFLACGLMRGQDAATHEIEIQGAGKLTIPDLVLRDQEGRRVRLYTDLIRDKVVVINFIYTSCTYTCGMQGRTFSKLQTLLGERLGKSVFLISVTTDPAKDNPQQLKAWAKRFDAQSGWTLVTGETAEMNQFLMAFTGKFASGGMHAPTTFIGNDKKGIWTSAVGLFAPEDLLNVVDFLTR